MMEDDSRQKRIRVAGIYIILILALLRFLVYPLHGAVATQKIVLDEQREAYRIKSNLLARQSAEPERAKPVADKSAVYPYMYEKEKSISSIQVDVLGSIIEYAQEKGLTVLNFELLDAVTGKNFSEVPVLVRLSGKPDGLMEMLKMVGSQKRALNVKNAEVIRSGQGLALFLTVSAFRMER
jgi:Tfp pilus assembly protein PilO